MRRIPRIALFALSSIFVASGVLAAGCGDGEQTTSTTSTGSVSSSSGNAGAGGIGGKGGMGGGGMGGSAGMGGATGGSAGSGGSGGSSCTDEVCDGLDNNCDGVIDEGCPCIKGDMQTCYDGDPSTVGVGVCVAGTQECDIMGVWGTCTGQILPDMEICNALDDDCNGNVDDGFPSSTCGIGACQVTVDGCSDGKPGVCVPLPPNLEETCEGTDDNCDGQVDEGCTCLNGKTQSCYTGPNGTEGVGACAPGIQTCEGGMWGPCMGDVVPAADETCNGIDDDCDGTKDEDLGVTVCGVGACHVTSDNCVAGMSQTCVPGNPQTEICNGIDDDCDLGVDENLGTISCGVGACAATVAACVNGQTSTCVPGNPTAELCDSVDNDCDGVVDNGNPGGGGSCMTGNQGACAAGVSQCMGGQIVCVQSNQSSAEICDGIDNDCNGTIDDNAAQVGTACMTGQPGVCSAGTRACTNGMLVCNPNAMSSPEVCDGLDNDCNGQTDNGNPGGGVNCNTGNLGICAAGSTSCVNGQIVCNQSTAPNVELCDGLDNDCNGTVDDNPQQVGTSCTTGQQGVCSAGTRACTNGTLVCNRNVNPSPEICDNLDNDCNGTVDNSPATVGDACTTGGQGVCSAGTKACTNGMITCTQTTQSSPEVCDGLDNDCNGTVDNGNPGGNMTCTTGQLGVCSAGTTACTNGAIVCNRNTNPTSEVCDGIDNDCDGMVDEGAATVGDPCTTGLPGVCLAGTKVCVNGTISCSQTNQPSAETCDGLDNDCNGIIDNGNPGGGAMCSTGQQGVCSAGTTACTNGSVVCNRNVNPSAETCDGLDNDCNGTVDNGNPGGGLICNTGQQGICSAGTTACSNGSVVCNRNNNPTTELCDGLDNDCNGTVDNGNPGGGQSCSTGQFGICAAGTTSCTGGMIACNRNNNPTTETCDGLDNDCNGVIDNGNPGGGVTCSTGQQGICSAGTTACSNGAVVCNRDNNPVPETCDGLDNDCNGTADNGNPGGGVSCTTGQQGICAAGTTSCTGGMIACNRNNNPTTETCDGLDNDCNGVIDNGNPGSGAACTTGQLGVCSPGTTSCSSGSIVCNRNTNPSAETCDGLDNDCNGVIDNGNPGSGVSCTTGEQGICSAGTTSCSGGSIVCNRNLNPAVETCDGLDNDCNGTVDNGNPGGGVSCSTGQQGICAAGTTACSSGAIVCNRNQNPGTEICDGLDNDCNGTVDNGNPGGGNSCNTGQQGICAAGTTACSAGAIVCNRNNNPGTEICDGLDNDCDGLIDEGNPGSGVACATGQQGVCSAGTTACSSGAIVCVRNVNPSAESCDGLDNDCNGTVDNGNPGGGVSCNTGQQGICSAGTTACTSGAIVCNRNQNPSGEVCDGLDNDCNGTVDNGNPGGGMACSTGQPGICSAGTTACSAGALVCNRINNPGVELCDNIDNDCNSQVDESNPNVTCSAQNPSANNVTTWVCSVGSCQVTSCQAGFANIDAAASNGCECATDVYPNSCAAATTTSVPIGAIVTFTGKVETASGSDWMRVAFTDRAVGQAYHPKIELTTNPGGQYAMDIQTACGTPAGCSTTGTTNNESGTNVNVWEQFYSGYVAGPSCCSDNTSHVTSVFVRVYRKNGGPPTCDSYTVTATNP